MITALIASFLALQAPAQAATKKVDLAQIALSFDCPKTWEINPNKKAEVHIVLPVPDAQTSATLDIYPVNFDAEPHIWQLSQEALTKQMKRDLVRQWEEEILGVQLLLTRANYVVKSVSRTSVVGLLYNDGPRKMMYRLIAAPEDFDKADFAWRTSLLTLRSYNGRPLSPQIPGKSVVVDPKQPVDLPTKPPKEITLSGTGPGNGSRPPKKAEKSLDLTVANRKVQLRYPADWTVAQDSAGAITMSNAGVTVPLTVSVLSTLDSDTAHRTLFKVSSETLNDFVKVNQRDEPPSATNLAGSTLERVWRNGVGDKGPLVTCDAVVGLGDFYLVLKYRTADAAKSAGERRVVEALLDQLSIESSGS